ncbi:FAD-dependent thymidylate synthase [Paenibacillus sp. NPDC057967]|uniref:FAD-dependent thymidylate synthase n=1 Tax=Paenibacillus sp. NPDC057967 TaxID=3346293 RepID=UPI0036DA8BB0
MNVKLIAHTALSENFRAALDYEAEQHLSVIPPKTVYDNERAAVALTAIRTCYSPLKPTEIIPAEGAKYFGQAAADGGEGTESDRLFRHISRSGHTSTLEHITYTFAAEGVSRSLLAQLTRHRIGFSFSVQSQRYVRFGSGDKSGGYEPVLPPSIAGNVDAMREYAYAANFLQDVYDTLREYGVPAEDARYVLPNAAACNIVMTVNLRALLEFYGKRRAGNGAQWEIADLAERLREEVTRVDAWTTKFFEEVSE